MACCTEMVAIVHSLISSQSRHTSTEVISQLGAPIMDSISNISEKNCTMMSGTFHEGVVALIACRTLLLFT